MRTFIKILNYTGYDPEMKVDFIEKKIRLTVVDHDDLFFFLDWILSLIKSDSSAFRDEEERKIRVFKEGLEEPILTFENISVYEHELNVSDCCNNLEHTLVLSYTNLKRNVEIKKEQSNMHDSP